MWIKPVIEKHIIDPHNQTYMWNTKVSTLLK
jgi:hypothetical protein